jgi:organic hydroperoxide reductase OsmC/OhrA
MIPKTEKHRYYFEVQLNHKEGRTGILSAKDVYDSIEVATPPEFTGGIAGKWSPEQLFLSALCGGLMTTFFAIAEKKKLQVCDFTCSSIGQVRLYEGHLEFTTIDLYPKVHVYAEADRELATDVLLKTYKHCIIANSISPLLVHHGEVLVCAKQPA